MNTSLSVRTRRSFLRRLRKPVYTALFVAATSRLYAQDGKKGIQDATSLINGYFDVGIDLMFVIGAVVGIVGAIKVYNAWSHGDQQTNKLAASWFGACIFLVVVATCLKSFFNVT